MRRLRNRPIPGLPRRTSVLGKRAQRDARVRKNTTRPLRQESPSRGRALSTSLKQASYQSLELVQSEALGVDTPKKRQVVSLVSLHFCVLPAHSRLGKMQAWTSAENSILQKFWRLKTDRELSVLLGRSLEAVRSRRRVLLGCRRASPFKRWEGKSGIVFENNLQDYLRGASQSLLTGKFHIEWNKLRQVLLSHDVPIRGNRSRRSWTITEDLLRSDFG